MDSGEGWGEGRNPKVQEAVSADECERELCNEEGWVVWWDIFWEEGDRECETWKQVLYSNSSGCLFAGMSCLERSAV